MVSVNFGDENRTLGGFENWMAALILVLFEEFEEEFERDEVQEQLGSGRLDLREAMDCCLQDGFLVFEGFSVIFVLQKWKFPAEVMIYRKGYMGNDIYN